MLNNQVWCIFLACLLEKLLLDIAAKLNSPAVETNLKVSCQFLESIGLNRKSQHFGHWLIYWHVYGLPAVRTKLHFLTIWSWFNLKNDLAQSGYWMKPHLSLIVFVSRINFTIDLQNQKKKKSCNTCNVVKGYVTTLH